MSDDVTLSGVPLTMLWTLHNRGSEVKRPDAVLTDPDCERLYDTIDFDYARTFGAPDGTHAVRSARFDAALRPWLAAHPGGAVVELAAGLETQFQRCDDGVVRWLCVDVPDAIAIRGRYLPPTERCAHLPISALDLTWLDHVDAARGVFVTAQGLLMYFEPADVRRLVTAILERFPGVELMFDTIPPWFSRKTVRGFRKTPDYTAPPMPWGVERSKITALLRSWTSAVDTVTVSSYGPSHGPLAASLPLFGALPVLRDIPPAIVHVRAR
ncbi:class I SAM-dependent methyltransferase [Nocardia asteroides NBRC 15531]|uniref:Methyltransferase n=1 Tax=Nocardia asteroides NBRC 15531 TaxID=1110697 RepID=U5EC42_NOCAS|nr:class I SAM-dependent methyltransferase [Nocardia asteroides]TLF62766.1 class I SAM-dependent methyltransferase [Nocardia asteroides NBRC 15531]UGT46419.1 class I SAM-dependent methyltransferase [Nocardia asteroides]SFN57584.1 Leucine carboxyl methyltransferase [Nocardia asteroides]VEG34765.1 O-Methyltransferase involved in polyketide biosynthesis [Nocardia asteroides]GAD87682.1 putative methyltransferase [Nocardia asteroides NBRC 15531]